MNFLEDLIYLHNEFQSRLGKNEVQLGKSPDKFMYPPTECSITLWAPKLKRQ